MTTCPGRQLAYALCASLVLTAPANGALRHVVVLYDERTDLPGLSAVDAALAQTLAQHSPDPIEIYRETLDRSRFSKDEDLLNIRDYLMRKYRGRTVDAVVAVMGPSLDFLLMHGQQIFPGTPVIFSGIDRRELDGRALPEHVTGVFLQREFAPTLELALTLHPATKRVVLVGGTSQFDRELVDQARSELSLYEDRVVFRYLTDLSLPATLREVAQLPPDTVVLYATMFRDGAGNAFVPHEIVERLSAAANAPVYGFVDQYLGHGIVGGQLYSMDALAEEAGRLTVAVLGGTSPTSVPPPEPGVQQRLFDARQLDRWGISERALPPGSVVRFGDASLWSRFKHYVVGAVLLVALQAAAIGVLLLQRTRRRRLEAELRASEELFRTIADTTPVMIWIANAAGEFRFLNRGWLAFTGQELAEAVGSRWEQYMHPDDLSSWQALRRAAPAVFAIECRLRRADGAYRSMLCAGVPRVAPNGALVDWVGSCVDISPLRDAELENRRQLAELAHVARIATLGQVTASVAHELNQPLAAIMANTDAAERLLGAARPLVGEVREALIDIRSAGKRASEIIRRTRRLLERHEVAYKAIDVDEAAAEVIELLRSEITARKISLSFEREAQGARVHGDYVHLQQVLMNLVLNACDVLDSCPKGSRRIRVQTELFSPSTIAISVTDSGPGVSPEALPRLFEPFYTTKPSGLGMGLAITRSIVEAHGGRIAVENGVDGGATFLVMLPIVAAEEECELGDVTPRAAASAP